MQNQYLSASRRGLVYAEPQEEGKRGQKTKPNRPTTLTGPLAHPADSIPYIFLEIHSFYLLYIEVAAPENAKVSLDNISRLCCLSFLKIFEKIL